MKDLRGFNYCNARERNVAVAGAETVTGAMLEEHGNFRRRPTLCRLDCSKGRMVIAAIIRHLKTRPSSTLGDTLLELLCCTTFYALENGESSIGPYGAQEFFRSKRYTYCLNEFEALIKK